MATCHPFLVAVRDGSLPVASFAAWLVQDYRFVTDLLWFQARLLARSPRHAQDVLAAGTVALVQELTWFEARAGELDLTLDAPPLPATAAYRSLLERLDTSGVPVALTALWAIERAYLDAWSFAAPGGHPYREFVGHWTTPEFADYVRSLAAAADRALADAATADVDAVFADVVRAEVDFWDMAWTGSRS